MDKELYRQNSVTGTIYLHYELGQHSFYLCKIIGFIMATFVLIVVTEYYIQRIFGSKKQRKQCLHAC